MKWGAVIASIGEDGVDTEMTTLPAILPLFSFQEVAPTHLPPRLPCETGGCSLYWLSWLSKDLALPQQEITSLMRIQGLKDWITEKGEQGQNSFVTVKSKPLLVQKLVALGVDPDSLQSLQARLNGTLKTVKEFRHPDRDENGLLHFEAVWTSTHMPSRVFYPDLNARAREHVSLGACCARD